MTGRCECCHKTAQLDRAHIRSKGAGGKWDADNILMLCRICHVAQHKMGWDTLLLQYPNLIEVLDEKGWAIEELFGIRKLRKK